jgi:hypothetical protein
MPCHIGEWKNSENQPSLCTSGAPIGLYGVGFPHHQAIWQFGVLSIFKCSSGNGPVMGIEITLWINSTKYLCSENAIVAGVVRWASEKAHSILRP